MLFIAVSRTSTSTGAIPTAGRPTRGCQADPSDRRLVQRLGPGRHLGDLLHHGTAAGGQLHAAVPPPACGWISEATTNSVRTSRSSAALWLALITFICVYGIRWTTNFQWVLVIIEYVAVDRLLDRRASSRSAASHPAGLELASTAAGSNPLHIHGFSALAAGLALGVFFFWGWDTALNLNEESKNRAKTPGQAGIISMWLLLLVFVLNFVAAQMLLAAKESHAQGSTTSSSTSASSSPGRGRAT